jgi:hypothetical protein
MYSVISKLTIDELEQAVQDRMLGTTWRPAGGMVVTQGGEARTFHQTMFQPAEAEEKRALGLEEDLGKVKVNLDYNLRVSGISMPPVTAEEFNRDIAGMEVDWKKANIQGTAEQKVPSRDSQKVIFAAESIEADTLFDAREIKPKQWDYLKHWVKPVKIFTTFPGEPYLHVQMRDLEGNSEVIKLTTSQWDLLLAIRNNLEEQ